HEDRWPALRSDAAGGLDPVEVGHADVHEDDIGLADGHGLDRLVPGPGLGDHTHVGLVVDDHPQTGTDHGLVVGEDDAECHGTATFWLTGSHADTLRPPPVPRDRLRVPPQAAARSSMPRMPLPGTTSRNRPSSSTTTPRPSAPGRTDTQAREAPE